MFDADVTMFDAKVTNVYISVGKIAYKTMNSKASLVSKTQKSINMKLTHHISIQAWQIFHDLSVFFRSKTSQLRNWQQWRRGRVTAGRHKNSKYKCFHGCTNWKHWEDLLKARLVCLLIYNRLTVMSLKNTKTGNLISGEDPVYWCVHCYYTTSYISLSIIV